MMDYAQKKKAGDVLCDIGKYMLTVVPFSYFVADKPDAMYVIIGTAFFGFLFVLFGLYLSKEKKDKRVSGTSEKRKIRVLRNSVFVVEEQKITK